MENPKAWITGKKRHKPLAQSNVFAIAFSSYATGMFGFTLVAPEQFPILRVMGITENPTFRFESFQATLILFALLLAWTIVLRQTGSVLDRGIPGFRLRGVGVVGAYLTATAAGTASYLPILVTNRPCETVANGCHIYEIWFYLFLQALLVGVIYEVYSHPVQKFGLSEPDRTHHQENWWKLAQTVFTAMALLVGILALSDTGVSLARSWGELIPSIGLISILYFVYLKRIAIFFGPGQ